MKPGHLDPQPWWGMLAALDDTPFEELLWSLIETGKVLDDPLFEWVGGLWFGLRAAALDVGPSREPAWARGLPPEMARVAVAAAFCARHHGQALDAAAWWSVIGRLDRGDGWGERYQQACQFGVETLTFPPLVRALAIVPSLDEPSDGAPGCEAWETLSASLSGILRGAAPRPGSRWERPINSAIEALERDLLVRRRHDDADDNTVEASIERPPVPLAEPWYSLPSVVTGTPLWMRGNREQGLVIWRPTGEVEVPALAFQEVRNRFAGKGRLRLAAHPRARESSSLGGFLRRLTGFNSASWVAARLAIDGWLEVEVEDGRGWLAPRTEMGPPVDGAAKV